MGQLRLKKLHQYKVQIDYSPVKLYLENCHKYNSFTTRTELRKIVYFLRTKKITVRWFKARVKH